jgi:hypothetical protein
MGHGHDHSHDTDTYYLDQLCMIGITGAFAGMCLALYFLNEEMLKIMLKPEFFPLVLATGITLLVIVLLRAAVLWREVGKQQAAHAHDHNHPHEHGHEHHHHEGCGHDHHHEHGAACDHDHGHHHEHAQPASAGTGVSTLAMAAPSTLPQTHTHGHSHDDHDHGWAPWRYVVLLVPMMLFLLGLPSKVLPLHAAVNTMDVKTEATLAARFISLGPVPLNQGPMLAFMTMDPADRTAAVLNKDANDYVAPLALDGTVVRINALRPGMDVVLHLKIDNQVVGNKGVEKVEASSKGPLQASISGTAMGVIKAVDVAEKTLTVTIKEGGSEKDETFDLEAPRFVAFLDLENLATNSYKRDDFRGKRVQVMGQFVASPGTDRVFNLSRLKIGCCAADAVQLNVPIVCRESLKEFQYQDWVRVTGRVEFWEIPNRPGVFQTIVIVNRKANIVKTLPDSNPYVR